MTSFSIKNKNKVNQRNIIIMVYVVLRLRSDVSPPSPLYCCHVLVHFGRDGERTAPVKSPESFGRWTFIFYDLKHWLSSTSNSPPLLSYYTLLFSSSSPTLSSLSLPSFPPSLSCRVSSHPSFVPIHCKLSSYNYPLVTCRREFHFRGGTQLIWSNGLFHLYHLTHTNTPGKKVFALHYLFCSLVEMTLHYWAVCCSSMFLL